MVGALLVHAAGLHNRVPELLLGVLTLLVGTVVSAVIAPLRYRQILMTVHADGSPMARRTCQLMTGLIVAVALLGSILAVRAEL